MMKYLACGEPLPEEKNLLVYLWAFSKLQHILEYPFLTLCEGISAVFPVIPGQGFQDNAGSLSVAMDHPQEELVQDG